MKIHIAPLTLLLGLCTALIQTTSAHPASGIIVDQKGQIFFIYSRHGVCKIDSESKLTYVHRTGGGHWMCFDAEGTFSHTQPNYFQRITPDGVTPAIIFADGGSPIAISNGNLYYVSGPEDLTPGGLQIARNTPGGQLSTFAPGLTKLTQDRGITGLTAGLDGNLYAACPNAVIRIEKNGSFNTVIDPIRLPGCGVDYPDNNTSAPLPFLRGLAVDKQGTIFAAATACHCVIQITSGGNVKPLLKVDRPWSPTGVALHGNDLYVLEYTHANEPSAHVWLPRVRKISADGNVITIATIEADTNIPTEP